MNKRIGFGIAVVAIALLAIASPVSASCPVDKSAGTYGGGLSYWHSTTSDPGTLSGNTWQIGAPGVWNNGNGGALDCNNVDQGIGVPGMFYFAGGDKIGLVLHMGTCGTGCPASNNSFITVVCYKKYGSGVDFLAASIQETPAGVLNFDYSLQGDHNMVVLPRPHVTSSSRAGTNVNLNVQIPGVSAGMYGPNAATGNGITGYNILSAPGTSDPGRNASSYTLRSSLTASAAGSASGPITVDCSNPSQDQWVVTQLQFEGGSFLGNTVSQATRVNCNPALADPKNYKLIPKKQGAGSLNPQTPGSN